MKIKLTLLFAFLFCNLSICFAQKTTPNRTIIELNEFLTADENGILISDKSIKSAFTNKATSYSITEQNIPIVADPFLAFSIVWEADNWLEETNQLQYRFYKNLNEKGAWKEVKIDGHADRKNDKLISQLIFEDKDQKFFDLRIVFNPGSSTTFRNTKLHFFNPGITEQRTEQSNQVESRTLTCPCPQPNFEGRLDWCPTGDCPEDSSPAATTVTHLIVHHSAGTNASSDWAGVVRSIWDYHVNVNGWDDIGYNWLIDPNGVLYEGRGDDVRGAHFCGTNTGTMGVCVLGDFTNISPTVDAKSILKNLLAWKSCDIDADPLGSSLHTA